MTEMDIKQEDLRNMRHEVLERAKALHQMINLAVGLGVVFLIASFWLGTFISPESFQVYILLIPIVFAGLTFNYQANQMTMEAVARYVTTISSGWDEYYASHKRKVQLTSFLKILPLLLPQLLPLFFYPSRMTQPFFWWVDIVLFLLVLFNFRYKAGQY